MVKVMFLWLLQHMDVIITLCGDAEESCPWTGATIQRVHWPIKDPVKAVGSEEAIMNEFRRARDEIKNKIEEFIRLLKRGGVSDG